MPTFIAGSTHTLKVQLKLPEDYEKDEDDLTLSIWLVNSKGKQVFVDYMGLKKVGRIMSAVHLTKTFQNFTYDVTMPKKLGQYKLMFNIPDDMFSVAAESDRSITIVKDEHP
jgi:hypothetical protein